MTKKKKLKKNDGCVYTIYSDSNRFPCPYLIVFFKYLVVTMIIVSSSVDSDPANLNWFHFGDSKKKKKPNLL